MSAKPRHFFQLAVATMFMLASVGYVWADDFPGSKPDRKIIKTQQMVDELFEKGDYERAYFIYRNELAPLGDKYAQYMVGYMNIVGKGTARDYIAGSAWYRLAAERGDKNFSRASDEVLQLFEEEQRLQSDKKYAELRLLFSDAMIITQLVEKDLDFVERRTTPNTGSYSGPENFFSADVAALDSAERARLAGIARDRIRDRLAYLRDTIDSGRPMAADELARIRQVEEHAKEVMQQ